MKSYDCFDDNVASGDYDDIDEKATDWLSTGG